jgi:uncharacterized membrane protein YuzA (DUF378 family)
MRGNPHEYNKGRIDGEWRAFAGTLNPGAGRRVPSARHVAVGRGDRDARMRTLNIIALVLVILGGLNWGLVGVFGFDVIAALFGGPTQVLTRIAYVLVGVAALYCLTLFRPVTGYERRGARAGERA